MKRIILLPIVIALVLSSCSRLPGAAKVVKATHTPPSNVSEITINNGKYHPKNVSVKVGSTLTWTNNDDTAQTVTSDAPGIFDSGPIAPGGTYQFTFNKAGVFPYHSTGTPPGYGTVTVTP